MKPMGPLLPTFGHFGIAALAFWAGIALFSKENRRMPASAVPQIIDLSGLNADEFEKQAKVKILENTDLIRSTETYRIRLGHIYGPSRSISMCESYDKITIVMKAEGMAIHGEAPTVSITAPCKAEKAANQTNEIVLPYKEISKAKAEDSEFEYEGSKIIASYIDGEWPYQFYIHSISLMGSENLMISLSDIRRINRTNFTLNW